MAKPTEICVVTANGERYDNWETVEVISAVDQVIDHAMLTVSEPSSGATSLSKLKLKPGDQATVTLAGQMVIDGMVFSRQGYCDATSHSVQIGICSRAHPVMTATVKVDPGQYNDQTLDQILKKVFGDEGVNFTLVSPAPDKMTEQEQLGETKFAFGERLSRMNNIHLVDDGKGGIIGFRGPLGNSDSQITEGRNMLSGRILLKNSDSAEYLTAVAQQRNQDSADDNSQVKADRGFQTTTPCTIIKFACESLANQSLAQKRVNHEADWLAYEEVDGEITVQGWINDAGTLWWNDRFKLIRVNSPLLLPENSFGFCIKGITHRQSNEGGTTTVIYLCRADGLGLSGGEPIGDTGDISTEPSPTGTP
jgi:prophage tail gpP-like protein